MDGEGGGRRETVRFKRGKPEQEMTYWLTQDAKRRWAMREMMGSLRQGVSWL
jgi:hypothetical protein